MSHSQIKDTDFEPIHYDDSDAEKIAGESTSFWKDAWRRFKQNKLAILGIIVIVFLAVMSITGTMISGQNYSDNSLLDANQSPSLEQDRKSTRLNSSHVAISYAVFCLKKK